jgi:hypothetical protein
LDPFLIKEKVDASVSVDDDDAGYARNDDADGGGSDHDDGASLLFPQRRFHFQGVAGLTDQLGTLRVEGALTRRHGYKERHGEAYGELLRLVQLPPGNF